MDDVLVCIVETLRQGKPLARAVIVSSEGSAPRTAGSCMLANADGLLVGSVGGGSLEGQALLVARQVLCEHSRAVLAIDLQGASCADMICGGRLRLLVEPLYAAELPHFEELAHALHEYRDVWSAVNLSTGERHILMAEEAGGSPAMLPSFLCTALASANALRHDTTLVRAENSEWLLERWRSAPILVLAGGGHVAQATARMADIAGFSVMVMDDREEFVTRQRFPSAISRRSVPHYQNCLSFLPIRSNLFLIILTRGHAFDFTVLEQALLLHRSSPFRYLGMIGSSRKRDTTYAALLQNGFSPAELAFVHCPVGLAIHAETPAEIAVSILAECIQVFRAVAAH